MDENDSSLLKVLVGFHNLIQANPPKFKLMLYTDAA